MPLFPSIQLLWKFSDLRDEAGRAVALLPQLNAALAEPLVHKKLALFAPIAEEVFSLLASGVKDLDPNLSFGAEGDTEAGQEHELRAVYASRGMDYEGVKSFFAKLEELAKQAYEKAKPYLKYLPYVLPFLGEQDEQ